jgi:SAM-dependent methyltransferase
MTDPPALDQVRDYFERRLHEHGTSARGADWNSEASQRVRFEQLLKVTNGSGFSILDYGCGTGALANYLDELGCEADYYGFDILDTAIQMALQVHAGKPRRHFFSEVEQLSTVDYTLASGIFNMRAGQTYEAWTEYVLTVLAQFNDLSRKGFASNFLTIYSDAEHMRPDLYYADPGFLFDHCKRHFSKDVALLHDYHLYDFTLIVRKE